MAVAEHGGRHSLAPGLIADADEARVGDPVAGGDEVLDHPFEAWPSEAALLNVPVTLADGDRRC